MPKYGFKIIGAWKETNNGDAKFHYLLEWSDEAVMKVGWDGFLSDEEWLSIRSSAKLVDAIEDKFLEPFPVKSV